MPKENKIPFALTVIFWGVVKLGDSVLWVLRVLLKIGVASTILLTRFIFFLSRFSLHLLKYLQRFRTRIQLPRIREKIIPFKPRAEIIFILPWTVKIRYFILGFLAATLLFFPPTVFYFWLKELPSPHLLSAREIPQTTKIYDRHGTLLYEIYAEQNRTLVPLSEIPQVLKQATIAIEDQEFYRHQGFNLRSIFRAGRETLINRNLQGGSTITQQLVKSALLTPEITLQRKIKELFLAFWAERLYSKDQILEMYLNQVPYGGTAWGAEAASQAYFGKKVKDLDLAESALLAGLPAAPTYYSPFGAHPELAKERQEKVLRRMAEDGYVDQEEAQKAEVEKLQFASQKTNIKAPHFVMYVREELVKRYGERLVEKGGLSITTTLDMEIQKKAEDIVRNEVDNLQNLQVGNGAALITSPSTGEILAMVGSKDYFAQDYDGNVNVVFSLRQPGSAIKVVNYAAALQNGFTPATILDDSPITYQIPGSQPYSPVNYDGRFHGRLPLRYALANSYNVPAVKVLERIGVQKMVETGRKMGITSWDDDSRFGLSLTLGGGDVTMFDMATVYGVLATGGKRVDLNPILEIKDSRGEILEKKGDFLPPQILPEGVAFLLTQILTDNFARSAAFGHNSVLSIPNYTVAVKTGTTNDKHDNWTIGYTPSFVITVWVGNNDNSPMNPNLTSGITGAAPIWRKIMDFLLEGKPDEPFLKPEEVVEIKICSFDGVSPCENCPTRVEYFLKGTEPKVPCQNFPSPSPTNN